MDLIKKYKSLGEPEQLAIIATLPATIAGAVLGFPFPHSQERRLISQSAASYLKSQLHNPNIDESNIRLQVDAVKTSSVYDSGGPDTFGVNSPMFNTSELQATVNPLEAIMASKPHTDAQLRTEIQAAATHLDDLAASIRDTYSTSHAGMTAAILYSAIVLAYFSHRILKGNKRPNESLSRP